MLEKAKIDEILSKTDIVEVIGEYAPGLKKIGKHHKTLCPFHSEKTPSFTVSSDKQMFFCFGCQTGGNALSFVMKIENITFIEAAKKLAQRAGVFLDENEIKKMSPLDEEKIEIKKVLSLTASILREQLKTSQAKNAVKTLQERGIKDETMRIFSIGYAPDSWDFLIKKLKQEKINPDTIRKAGLATAKDNGEMIDAFRNRIMFPIKGFDGSVIAFGGRILSDGVPKYLNSQETLVFSKRNVLFGLYESLPTLRKVKKAVIVEGYMDVLMLHQYGLTFSVSPLGTSLSAHQCQTLKRYVEEVVILFDPDTAGINAAIKAADLMIENGLYPKICLLEDKKDPDEYILEKGIEALYHKLQSAKDAIDFKIEMVKNSKKDLNPNEKTKITAFLMQTVIKQKDPIIKSEWMKRISESFGISEKTLLSSYGKETFKTEQKDYSFRIEGVSQLEKGFVHILIKQPELIKNLEGFSHYFLKSDFAKTVYSHFKNESFDILEMAEKYPQYSRAIMALNMEDISSDISPAENLRKTCEALMKNHYTIKWKDFKKRIATLSEKELLEFNELSKIIKK